MTILSKKREFQNASNVLMTHILKKLTEVKSKCIQKRRNYTNLQSNLTPHVESGLMQVSGAAGNCVVNGP